MSQYILAPSLLASDYLKIGEQIAAVERAGADWLHMDIMDGSFVPNITFGTGIVEACKRGTNLPLDVHLMIEHPEHHLEAFAKAGADRLTVHVETSPHLHRTLQVIQSLGIKAGVTLNPSTPAVMLEPVLHMVDLVLVMSVNPGFGGQGFIPESLAKIAQIRGMLNAIQSSAWLEVDGGIAEETITRVRDAGATAFVAGTSVFRHPRGIEEGIRKLRASLG